MADRHISREWLLEELGKYKDIREKWSTKVCDPDTILRVLHVMENLVNIAPNIVPIQYGNKKLEVKNAALKSELKYLKGSASTIMKTTLWPKREQYHADGTLQRARSG